MRQALPRPALAKQALRAGFTLIELLVVIAIISVLAALTVAGIFTTVESQRQSNTEAAMRNVMKTLEQHWAFVVEQAKKEPPSRVAKILAGGTPPLGDDADKDRARVIWIKLRLMEAFPVSYAEIASAPVYQVPPWWNIPAWGKEEWIPASAKRRYIAQYQRTLLGKGPTGNPATEPSACLFMSLSVPRDGSKLEADTLGSAVIRDTDNDLIPEIVDNWGTAMAFFRFPTGTRNFPLGNTELQALAPPVTIKGSRDPLDPQGTLLNIPWFNSFFPATKTTRGDAFNAMFHVLNPDNSKGPLFAVNQKKFGGPYVNSFYIVPVLVSAGRDKVFGLDLLDPLPGPQSPLPNTMTVTTAPNDYDNIYSFRLRLGARGD